jgi:hypothetical protein
VGSHFEIIDQNRSSIKCPVFAVTTSGEAFVISILFRLTSTLSVPKNRRTVIYDEEDLGWDNRDKVWLELSRWIVVIPR